MAKILIMDDSSYMRRLIHGILKKEGHEVLEAEDGVKGLQIVSSSAPDCILLDLIMPEIDGYKVLHMLHEQKKNIPVIVLTADIQESVRKQCLDLGAVAFLNKPPKEESIIREVRQALSTRGGGKQ